MARSVASLRYGNRRTRDRERSRSPISQDPLRVQRLKKRANLLHKSIYCIESNSTTLYELFLFVLLNISNYKSELNVNFVLNLNL
jgi:hypothetical protein